MVILSGKTTFNAKLKLADHGSNNGTNLKVCELKTRQHFINYVEVASLPARRCNDAFQHQMAGRETQYPY